jgi:heme O synthase-like polyprenyltransferase
MVLQKLKDYTVLGKVRLTVMVLCSGLVVFWLASGAVPNWTKMFWFAAGTFLVIAGANAFNQVAERSLDRLMERTAKRPLPSGRMTVREAVVVSTIMSVTGLGTLAWATNPLTFLGRPRHGGIPFLVHPLENGKSLVDPCGRHLGCHPRVDGLGRGTK